MTAELIPFRRVRPRYSAAIAAEGWMEIKAQVETLRSFIDEELRDSWQSGRDVRRMRELQRVVAATQVIETVGLKHAGWAEGIECADGVAEPGHGRAA